MVPPQPIRQRAARKRLDEFLGHPGSVWVIHYACQSFFQGERLGSPRVTAVAARQFESGETVSFSIAIEAELARLTPMQILGQIDTLERRVLDKVSAFLALNRSMRFVHWNMRDATYGFAAIEHRTLLLGGTPTVLPDTNKLDLAKTFTELYGLGYAGTKPRETLAELNGQPLQGFLSGNDEAAGFERGEYRSVHSSTLVKVKLIADFAELAQAGTLKTHASWWTLNVGRLREAYETFERNPVVALASLVFAGVGTGFGLIWQILR